MNTIIILTNRLNFSTAIINPETIHERTMRRALFVAFVVSERARRQHQDNEKRQGEVPDSDKVAEKE